MDTNAHALARYSALVQEAGMVPIVEPEVLMDGKHSIEDCFNKTSEVIKKCFDALIFQKIDLKGVILAIKNSDFYSGNNSGPLNLSAALGINTFGLIATDPVSELKYSKIKPIVPDGYVDNVWIRNRSGMKKLKPQKVFDEIIKSI